MTRDGVGVAIEAYGGVLAGALGANVSGTNPSQERSKRPLEWRDLPEGRLTPRPPKPQRRVSTFFP